MKQKLTDAALDLSSSAWTWLGMGTAWLVLPDGTTRDFVGTSIGVLMVLWLLTGPLRWGSGD